MQQLPFEMEFILNLTYKCNLHCEMCTQYGENFKENACEDLNIDIWLNFLDSIKDLEPKPKIILMGGEPLLYKNFDKLFLTAKKYNIKTHIITNGYYLDKYIKIFKDSDTCITISIDGLFEIHNSIRGLKGLFEKIVKNIEEIDKLQKQGSQIELRINHVLLPSNIEQIVDFHKYFDKYKIETFTFQHLQFSSDKLNKISQKEWKSRLGLDYCNGLIPHKKYNLDEEFIYKLKKSIENFKKYCKKNNCFAFPALEDDEYSDYYNNKNLENLRKYRICTTAWLNPTIHPNGDVSNCIGNVIGNIKENNFWDIWNNEKAQNFRNCLIKNGKFTICTKCCNFYKGNFILANDSHLEVNGYKLKLPGELNYIQSSKKIAFIKDSNKSQDEYISVFPVNIHNQCILNEIKENNTIVTIIE